MYMHVYLPFGHCVGLNLFIFNTANAGHLSSRKSYHTFLNFIKTLNNLDNNSQKMI